jgi:hypothetical protein
MARAVAATDEKIFLDKRSLLLSCPFSKIDDEKREVWGVATTEALDSQGEIVDYEASKKAFEDWTDQFVRISAGETMGNIREMHQPKPVGKLIAYKPDDATKRIMVGVKISRSPAGDEAWQKVKERVLNGFSIGAPQADRRIEYVNGKPRTRVIGYKLSELSLVDNPACPEAWFTEIKLAKAARGEAAVVEGPLAEMALDAEPSGRDIEVVTENAYVDPSGAVWKRVGGTFKKENAMSGAAVAKKDNIGPNQRTAASPPGPDVPEVAGDPEAGRIVKPKKADGTAGGMPEGSKVIPGGPHDDASKPAEVPDTQGKAADAMTPPGTAPLAAPAAPAAPRYGYCAYCAGKLADGTSPFHQECNVPGHPAPAAAPAAPAAPVAAGAPPPPPPRPAAPPPPAPMPPAPAAAPVVAPTAPAFRAAGTELEAGLEKAFSAGLGAFKAEIGGAFQKMNDQLTKVANDLETLKRTPIPGGPSRAELPGGVHVVEKGGSSTEAQKLESIEKAFDDVLAVTADPMLKDQLSRERSRLEIMKAQAGKGVRLF